MRELERRHSEASRFRVLVVVQTLAGLIVMSVFFVEEPERFESDANTLISAFGIGMAVFGIGQNGA